MTLFGVGSESVRCIPGTLFKCPKGVVRRDTGAGEAGAAGLRGFLKKAFKSFVSLSSSELLGSLKAYNLSKYSALDMESYVNISFVHVTQMNYFTNHLCCSEHEALIESCRIPIRYITCTT